MECEVVGTLEDIAGVVGSKQEECTDSDDDDEEVRNDPKLFDIEWLLDELLNATDIDKEDNNIKSYERFGAFAMPKSMHQYKWEVRTYFTKKKEFTEAI